MSGGLPDNLLSQQVVTRERSLGEMRGHSVLQHHSGSARDMSAQRWKSFAQAAQVVSTAEMDQLRRE